MRLVTVFLAIGLSACAGLQDRPVEAQSIEAFRDSYVAAFNRCDVDGLLSHYASDFRFISRAAPRSITTLEQLRQYYARACALAPLPRATLLEHRIVHGDTTGALDGVFQIQQPTSGLPPVTLHGTMVLRKVAGAWRIVVFHSSEVRPPSSR